MLTKFFSVHNLAPFSRRDHPKPPNRATLGAEEEEEEEASMALKIVHAGGRVECYYMAVPASTILEKHPSFVLAKPEVFRRPWDSVVRPEKILRPGQKFLLVPLRTVKKLRRRIRKPHKDQPYEYHDHHHIPIINDKQSELRRVSSGDQASGSFGGSALKKKNGVVKKHVRFAGIDGIQKTAGSVTSQTKKGLNSSESKERKRWAAANAVAWQPSLTSVSEIQGN